jgi:mannose-1-phosphate guanylyltransferase
MSQHFVVILAGGKGERFWPLSRQSRPKQLLPIVGDTSMLAQTLARVGRVVPRENVLIITNAAQAAAVRRCCPGVPARNVIAEPVGRDSAAAVGLAAALVEQRAPQGVFAILAADHVIHDEAAFRRDLQEAFAAAAASPVMVTIGIVPNEPVTGYGYIKVDKKRTKAPRAGRILPVERFVEKPDLKTAKAYLASGDYFWNAGMFVWSVPVVLQAFAAHAPALARGLHELRRQLGSGKSLAAVLKRVYPGLEKISVDYALLEHAKNVVVLPASFDWDDVGAWPAVARHRACDSAGNVQRGNAVVEQGSGNIVISEGSHLVTVLGADNLVVVHTADATLVCPRDRAQDIKALLKRLAADPAGSKVL